MPGSSSFRKRFWIPVFAKIVLSRVKNVIANSNYTSLLVKKVAPKSKTIALPLGVDTKQFKPLGNSSEEKSLNISTLSRVLQFKGYDEIFGAINGLDENLQKKIVWNIGGTGPYLEPLKEKINNGKCNFKVHFHGFIPDEKLVDFYNKANLFVLFTQNKQSINNVEGFGLVFLEAQACGVPVIGTNTGGIPDAIHTNDGGWILEQDDVDGLTSLLEKVINEPSILKEQSVKARKRTVDSCDWKVYNKELFNLLQ